MKSAIAPHQSFWQLKFGDYKPNQPLMAGKHLTDVAIIGAGFTGLTAARELKRDNPGLKVMVLDKNEIGFGASGRNGGFSMTLFGLEPETTVLRWGKEKARQAQSYTQQAVAYVKNLIEEHQLDSDYEHTGMWRVAYSKKQIARLKKTYTLLNELSSPGSFEFYTRDDIQRHINAPAMQAAIVEPETGILDPCKHVRELKLLAEREGVEIFENTPVTTIESFETGVLLRTDQASVQANKLLIATNAWSHTLQGEKKLVSRQRPVWTYQIVSDPLTDKEWSELGWSDRMSIEDNRQLVHYMRITKCGRITLGGGNIGVEYGSAMDKWHDGAIWAALEEHFRWLFPSLKDKKIYYKWGGAVSGNIDMTPEIGFINNKNIIYSSGCIGHGVSLTQMNGRIIADLLQENDTERSTFWIVNRKAIPIPPGHLLAYAGVQSIKAALKAFDWYEERSLNGKKR